MENVQGLTPQILPKITEVNTTFRETERVKTESTPVFIPASFNLAKNETERYDKGITNAGKDGYTQKPVDFNRIASKLHSMLGEDDLSVEFSLDRETKRMILKVLDMKTKEIVQQFPPEITLKIARIVANTLGNGGQVTNATI